MATKADLDKLINQKLRGDLKRLREDPKGKKKPQGVPNISALQNINEEDQEVRMLFHNVDVNNVEEFKNELNRFAISKPKWKGRRAFFMRFLNEVPDELFRKFVELYMEQGLNFKEFFDTKFKPKYLDNVIVSGKYDEIMRVLLGDYISNPLKYAEKSERIKKDSPEQLLDMISAFDQLEKKEKAYFAQLYLENKYPYDEFYLRYKAGTLDKPKEEPSKEEPTKEEPTKEEPSKEEPEPVNRVPLMVDEDGNVVPMPTGYNLYKFNRPRNRLPILSSQKDFKDKLDNLKEISGEIVDLAKIELKTNLNLSSNQIDDILLGLIEKYDSLEPFVKKLGKIVFYYINRFVIRNQNNKVASLYKTRIDNGLFNMKGLAYAKKYDFLPELFEFDDHSYPESRKLVKKIIKKQVKTFLNNFKLKLYALTNASAKIKNIHSISSDIVIESDFDYHDYHFFGYSENNERRFFDLRQVDFQTIPVDVAHHIAKVYVVDDTVPIPAIPVAVPVDDEQIDIQSLYNDFVSSLQQLDVGIELFGSETKVGDSPDREEDEEEEKDEKESNEDCLCEKCGSKSDQSLKTKIKAGKQYKTICFCSFKCFEKFKN